MSCWLCARCRSDLDPLAQGKGPALARQGLQELNHRLGVKRPALTAIQVGVFRRLEVENGGDLIGEARAAEQRLEPPPHVLALVFGRQHGRYISTKVRPFQSLFKRSARASASSQAARMSS